MVKANIVKLRNGVIAILMIAVLLASAFQPAFAMEDFDTETPMTLTASFTGKAAEVDGLPLDVYKIASMDEDLDFQVEEKFTDYGINFSGINNQDDWRTIGVTLRSYIMRDQIEPDYSKVTVNGTAEFGEVEPGLYLVLGPDFYVFDETEYSVDITLVAVPGIGENENWINEVVFSPKYTYNSPPPAPSTKGLKAIKIWKDEDVEGITRPESIELELVCDGEVVEVVTLNKENGWTYEWGALDSKKTHTITEKNVPEGYTVGIDVDGDTCTVTNTAEPPEEPPTPAPEPPKNPTPTPTPTPSVPQLPNTGVPWIPAIILGASGIVLLFMGIFRRNSGRA